MVDHDLELAKQEAGHREDVVFDFRRAGDVNP